MDKLEVEHNERFTFCILTIIRNMITDLSQPVAAGEINPVT